MKTLTQKSIGTKQVLSNEEQKEYMLGKIGKPVKFNYPQGEETKMGTLVDRVVCLSSENDKVIYWNLFDLIRFENEDEDWLRLSYYRYKKEEKKWVFAGQTSLTDPYTNFTNLFIKVIREKAWIRPLFRKVHEQCKDTL